jgi:hypothetical protein
MKIQIKNRFTGSILFEHECENNTIKETLIRCANLEGANLECADLLGADLRGANLEGANLEYANLRCANLEGANLRCANLECANLEGANLEGANLRCANLEGANLRCANLEGANLEGANLECANLPIFSKWSVSIINKEIIKIGCKEKNIKDWDLFFAGTEEFETKRGTSEFKQIEAMYLAHKTYLTHLKS